MDYEHGVTFDLLHDAVAADPHAKCGSDLAGVGLGVGGELVERLEDFAYAGRIVGEVSGELFSAFSRQSSV
ncbi:hypothetical protein [Actinopolymorpha pittospori]|uniref:Uncharacterized protein n=1 Tax=Actinopolymorpha pittospori TaxID=648752 RepID=A0A927MR80_9ACTN|nr:hypothetical protein [Actinopolymorpha pittospori]MBE1604762.1 hypothetical protein [Actinopolymorpha pittospori]